MMIPLVDALIVLLAIAAIALCVVIWREDKQWEAHREEIERASEDARGENRQCNPMSSTEEEL